MRDSHLSRRCRLNLTYQRGQYLYIKALETYLIAVEASLIPLLPTDQRLRFVERLTSAAAIQAEGKPNLKKKASKEYKDEVTAYFANLNTVLKIWKRFEINQAEIDGRLSPERIVFELTAERETTYSQRSALQTYALNAINSALERGYDLTKILNCTRQAVRQSPVYRSLDKTKAGVKI